MHTFRLVNGAGRHDTRQVPLEAAAGMHARCSGRSRRSWAASIPTSTARDLWTPSPPACFLSTSSASRCCPTPRTSTSRASISSTPPRSCPRSSPRSARSASLTLDRNPSDFFAETEQVAFDTAHLVPGIESPTTRCCRPATSRTSTRSSPASADRISRHCRSTVPSRPSTRCNRTASARRRSSPGGPATRPTRSAEAVPSRRRWPTAATPTCRATWPARRCANERPRDRTTSARQRCSGGA